MHGHPHLAILRMRLRALANRIHESLLVVPALMVTGALLLVLVLGELDARLPPTALPSFLRLSPEASIQLLSTLAGAMVTTAGVVFSLIVVSLQLASGQFSPRVLRSFFRDPLGKVVVGLLAAVFTYCVVTLQTVPSTSTVGDEPVDVPDLTVDMAVLLTLVSVGFLVVYLQRISRRQYVGDIVAAITVETLEHVRELARAPPAPRLPMPDLSGRALPHVVLAHCDGWVQQVSRTVLLAAVPAGSVVRLETRVGAFIVRGVPLATLWPAPRHPHAVDRAVRMAVVVGDVRTMQQDVDFGLRQLTDIALRALSPAVNDPTTAVEVVLRLASLLRPLLLTDLPPQVQRARNGTLLLTPWDLDHHEYVRHAFDQLRRHAASHPQVAIALARSLRMLIEAVEGAGRHALTAELERQLALTVDGCRSADLLEEDVEAVREAATRPQHPHRQLGGAPPPISH